MSWLLHRINLNNGQFWSVIFAKTKGLGMKIISKKNKKTNLKKNYYLEATLFMPNPLLRNNWKIKIQHGEIQIKFHYFANNLLKQTLNTWNSWHKNNEIFCIIYSFYNIIYFYKILIFYQSWLLLLITNLVLRGSIRLK